VDVMNIEIHASLFINIRINDCYNLRSDGTALTGNA